MIRDKQSYDNYVLCHNHTSMVHNKSPSGEWHILVQQLWHRKNRSDTESVTLTKGIILKLERFGEGVEFATNTTCDTDLDCFAETLPVPSA